MHAYALNCTLKTDGPSSTDVLLDQIEAELGTFEVGMTRDRVAACGVAAGVDSNMGSGDGWARRCAS